MNFNLHSSSGLPIEFNKNSLVFGEDVVSEEVDVRTLKEVKGLLLDTVSDDDNRKLYYMYRDVHLLKDEKAIRERGLRYDITIIPPGKLGREYVKTAGHYHPEIPGKKVTYPEIYEVLRGEAHYLLQKKKEDSDEIERAVVIKAKAGDKVLIPPGYGHITINPSKEVLVMANWVADNFKSIYGPIQRKRGGAYYEIEEGNEFRWIPNTNYKDLPNLEEIDVKDNKEFVFDFHGPLYTALYQREEALNILIDP